MNMCLIVFVRSPFLFRTLTCYRLFQKNDNLSTYLNFWWPLNGGNKRRVSLIRTSNSWPQLLSTGGLVNRGFIYSILLTIILGP